MPTPLRRRWFRFSLRTMFVVVTVFAVWLGYSLNWIRERHEIWAHAKQMEASVSVPAGLGELVQPPLSLQLLGERRYASRINVLFGISVTEGPTRPLKKDEEEEVERIRRAFPESEVSGFARGLDDRWLKWARSGLSTTLQP